MRLLQSEDALAVMTIWAEARNQSYEGKVAVGEVIRNRMRLKFFSDGSIAGTVCRYRQFSCWNPGDPNRAQMLSLDDQDPMYTECLRAWGDSVSSDLTSGAVLYLNQNYVQEQEGKLPVWAIAGKKVATIDDHAFYEA